MLNIASKKEAEKAIVSHKNRFEETKQQLTTFNLQRDRQILLDTIIPAFKKTLALKKLFEKIDHFSFTMPLFDLCGQDFSVEDLQKIHADYYSKNQMYQCSYNGYRDGFVCKFNTVFQEELSFSPVFSKCEINVETQTVQFEIPLLYQEVKRGFENELEIICNEIDSVLNACFNFDLIVQKINDYYKKFNSNRLFSLYQTDIHQLPITNVNLDSLITSNGLFSDLCSSQQKADFDVYLNKSSLIAKTKKKLQKFGYSFELHTTRLENEPFRTNGFDAYLDASRTPHASAKSNETLITSVEFQKAFERKRMDYEVAMAKLIVKQNDSLVELVENGTYDSYIAEKLLSLTLMNKGNIQHSERVSYFVIDDIRFSFKLPFDRKMKGLTDLGRLYHISDGIGGRYMEWEGNMVEALLERYPFLQEAQLTGDSFYDFKYRTGLYGTEAFKIDENSLHFGFYFDKSKGTLNLQKAFEFLSSYYGTLDVSSFFKKIHFSNEGISEIIQNYISSHKEARGSVQEKFRIVLGNVDTVEITQMYQTCSFYENTKDIFEAPLEKESRRSYDFGDRDSKFVAHIEEQSKCLKLINLFGYSLLQNAQYQQMVQSLKEYGYNLKFEVLPIETITVNTGHHNVYREMIRNDVHLKYKFQLVIE